MSEIIPYSPESFPNWYGASGQRKGIVKNYRLVKRITVLVFTVFISLHGLGQTAYDLFNEPNTQITWLGVDFSNIKLVGNFSQFSGAGEQSFSEIRDDYFPGWNRLILNEPKKYDIKGMLRKHNMLIKVDMIMELNAAADVSQMQAYNNPDYTSDDIVKFIGKYDTKGMAGIGVCFIAEAFNKINEEAYLHFVAINLETKQVIVHERLKGIPGGIGLRNYWAGSIYRIIKDIKANRYRMWKSKYSS